MIKKGIGFKEGKVYTHSSTTFIKSISPPLNSEIYLQGILPYSNKEINRPPKKYSFGQVLDSRLGLKPCSLISQNSHLNRNSSNLNNSIKLVSLIHLSLELTISKNPIILDITSSKQYLLTHHLELCIIHLSLYTIIIIIPN